MPVGLEDVSKYPALFDLLRKLNPRRWTIENLEKLAGRNVIRVFKAVEAVSELEILLIGYKKIMIKLLLSIYIF